MLDSSKFSSLREYLIASKVDEIEDDNEFCEAEFDEIQDWYSTHKRFTEDDVMCLENRGYEPDQFEREDD